MNWSSAKTQGKGIILANGESLEWLQRVVSGSDAYTSGSTVTYGYGDETIWWTTGSLTAIIVPAKEGEVVLEAGFFQDDYQRLFVDPTNTLGIHDQIIYPSGSGIRYLVLTDHNWNAGNQHIVDVYTIRRLVPKSGSAY